MAISVIIKGNKFEAARACADRGIPFAFKTQWHKQTGLYETVGRVPDSFHDLIAQWFISAPHEAPFPTGTVLHYSLGQDD